MGKEVLAVESGGFGVDGDGQSLGHRLRPAGSVACTVKDEVLVAFGDPKICRSLH